jgi:uncharacterized protein YoxC
MGLLDWTSNGTLADEALLITAIAGFIGTLTGIWFQARRTKKTVERIDSNLNHLDEPVSTAGPTLGQRIKKIDERVDGLEHKIDGLHTDVRALSNAMLSHITDESQRSLFLEQKVRELDRRKDWNLDGQQQDHAD